MNNPLVSIIIPIYNSEAFLDKCIQSAINQSYKNIEVILVDEGSIDSSGEICDNYSSIDKDEYISKSNSQISLIFQIEGEAGVNNIDDIIEELPSNSRLFIGPYDLSQSLGIPGQIWDTRVVEKMSQIVKKCKDRNVKVGTFTDSYDGLKYWTELELDFIEYASDLNVFMNGFKSAHAVVLETIKSKYMKFGDNYQ